MNRRTFLAGVGTGALAGLAGCTRARRALRRRGRQDGPTDFEYPPGFGAGGVTDPGRAAGSHYGALAGGSYVSELLVPEAADGPGRILGAGDGTAQAWDIDWRISEYRSLYLGDGVQFIGRPDRVSRLAVGDWSTVRRFATWHESSVGAALFDALDEPPYDGAEVTVDESRDPPTVTYVKRGGAGRRYESVDLLRVTVDAEGLLRSLTARYTPADAAADPDQVRYSYDLSLTDPPAERVARPEVMARFPTFESSWRSEGRVLAVHNGGGWRVALDDANDRLRVDGLAGPERTLGYRDDLGLPPGETVYLSGDPLIASTEPPDVGASAPTLRGEGPPRFHYEDEEGAFRTEYVGSCRGYGC